MDHLHLTGVTPGSPQLSTQNASSVDSNAPRLLLELEPRGRGFLTSAAAAIFHRNDIVAGNNGFWPDVLLSGGLPRRGFAQSAVLHLAMIAAIYGVSRMPHRSFQIVEPHPEHQTITYYRVADELPALHVEAKPGPKARAADPVYAPQEVISLPPAPEQFRQRIITPNAAKLNAEQPLPNIVAWNPALPAPPLVGAEKLGPDLQLNRTPSVVAPAPEDIDRALGTMSIEVRAAVPPPVKDLNSRATLDAPMRTAVAPETKDAARNFSSDKLAGLQPTAVAPAPPDVSADLDAVKIGIPQRLAVPAAPSDLQSRNRNALLLPERVAVEPPARDTTPNISGGANPVGLTRAATPPPTGNAGGPGSEAGEATGQQLGAGQMVVLGLNPAQPNGAIDVPRGNLNGAFAGSPHGTPDATGAPALIAGGSGAGGNATGPNDALSGITITGRSAPSSVPVVAANTELPNPAVTPALPPMKAFAPIRRSSVLDIARTTSPGIGPGHDGDVFRSRQTYSMAVNMPNLSSVSGSWIIHFAEVAGAPASVSATALVPPDMVVKADPGYPADLIRQGVQGTVVLYAVIHSDGSVGNVRLMEGVDARLDHYAEIALAECRFRPATRNGAPVELEAVIQIPFRATALR